MQLQQYFRCMDHEIHVWLNSEQDYSHGLSLYNKHGRSRSLSRKLTIGGVSQRNRQTLAYELGKLVKITAIAPTVATMPNTETAQDKSTVQEITTAQNTAIAPNTPTAPSAMVSQAQQLADLGKEQKMIYKMLDNLHSILPYQQVDKRKEIAFQILSLDDRLKEITVSLDHYQKHGILPLVAEKEDVRNVSELSEAELIKRLANVRTYIARYKRLAADSINLKDISRNRDLEQKYQLEQDDIIKRLNK